MKGIYSTAEVAKELNIAQQTLLRWLYAKEIPEPEKIQVGHDRRIWTEEDVENLKRYKELHYAKRR